MTDRLTDEELANGLRSAEGIVRAGMDVHRPDVLVLAEMLRRVAVEARASRELLAKLEWAGEKNDQGIPLCPACGAYASRLVETYGYVTALVGEHDPDCRLVAALGREEPKP